jgi:hypothetical protein
MLAVLALTLGYALRDAQAQSTHAAQAFTGCVPRADGMTAQAAAPASAMVVNADLPLSLYADPTAPLLATSVVSDPHTGDLYLIDRNRVLRRFSGNPPVERAMPQPVLATSLALNRHTRRLYAAADTQTLVLDPDTGGQLGTIPQGGRVAVNERCDQVVLVKDRAVYIAAGATHQVIGNLPGVVVPDTGGDTKFDQYPVAAFSNAATGDYLILSNVPMAGHGGRWTQVALVIYDGQNFQARVQHFVSGAAQFDPLTQALIVSSERESHYDLTIGEQALPLAGQFALDAEGRRLYIKRGAFLRVLDVDKREALGYYPLALAEADASLVGLRPVYPALLLVKPDALKLVGINSLSTTVPPQSAAAAPTRLDDWIFSVQMSPDYPRDQTVFALGREGLYKSVDGGAKWRTVLARADDAGGVTFVLSPHYATDETIFVLWSTHNPYASQGVYRSTDGGASWELVNTGLRSTNVHRLRFSPGYAQDRTLTLLNSDFGLSNKVFLMASKDNGQSWQVEREAMLTELVHPRPATPTPLAAFLSGRDQWACYSSNVAQPVTLVSQAPRDVIRCQETPAAAYPDQVVVAADGQTVFATLQLNGFRYAPNYSGIFLFRSTDAGQTWTYLGGTASYAG